MVQQAQKNVLATKVPFADRILRFIKFITDKITEWFSYEISDSIPKQITKYIGSLSMTNNKCEGKHANIGNLFSNFPT